GPAHFDMGREGDHGGGQTGGPVGADDSCAGAAGGSGTRATHQDHSRRGRVYGGGEAVYGGGSDSEAARGASATLLADSGRDRSGEEYDHRFPASARYTNFFGASSGESGKRWGARHGKLLRHEKQRDGRVRTGSRQQTAAQRLFHCGAAVRGGVRHGVRGGTEHAAAG